MGIIDRFKSWFKRGVNSIVGTPELFKALDIEVPISPKMRDAIELWAAMHENRAPWLNEDVQSLNLAATISSELSRLVTIEMQSSISGSPRADFLNIAYQHVIDDSRVFTEFAAARGDLILKPYIDGEGLAISYVKAGDHFSLAFDSNNFSTSELFLDWRVIQENTYIRAEVQTFETVFEEGGPEEPTVGYGRMKITNKVIVKHKNGASYYPASLSDVPDWANIAPSATISNVKRPLWGQFKMPFANNIDPNSPLGVSVYSKAAGLIEQADKQYSRLLWEMESGERALYVDETAFPPDRNGNRIYPHKKRLFIGLNIEKKTGEALFEDWSPSLREQNIINGLNEILAKVEDTSGLARGTFSDRSEGQAMTATQIKILRQRTYATVTDTQKALEMALDQLVYALDVWATVGGLAPAGTYTVKFEWDDSVVTDRTEEYNRIREAVAAGWLKPEYLVQWLGIKPMNEQELVAAREFMPGLADVD